MTQPEESSELETAVVAVYRGPLEEFISRRDALAKELRAAKRREDADRVKALRKPSRTAWVLDNIVHEDPSVLDQLTAAIGAAQTVHSGADLRAALDNVRTAIRDVAAAGARVAIRAGQPIDASALVTAVHAVIGETSAFNDLRAGRLVEVPAGGGLDILSAITISVPSPPSVAPSQPIAAPIPAPPNAAPSAESARQAEQKAARAIAAARADLQRAEASLATAREQSDRAAQSVRETQATLDAAEQALSHAQSEAQARRIDVDRARRDAETAATQVREAERAVAAARARVPDSSGT
jgi:exonuclease VII small subunit